MYPNPSNGNLTLEKELEDESNVQVSDLSGNILYKSSVSGKGASSIDLNSVQNGVYLLEVITGTTSDKFKIMIVK